MVYSLHETPLPGTVGYRSPRQVLVVQNLLLVLLHLVARDCRPRVTPTCTPSFKHVSYTVTAVNAIYTKNNDCFKKTERFVDANLAPGCLIIIPYLMM